MDIDDIFYDFDDAPELLEFDTVSDQGNSPEFGEPEFGNVVSDEARSDKTVSDKRIKQTVMQKIEIYLEEKNFVSDTLDVFDSKN